MGIGDVTEALIKLGLPCLLFTWVIFHWLFTDGHIDRDIQHKVLKSQLKNSRKRLRNNASRNARFVYNRWLWFGGGFYGLAGLWTFLAIEMGDLASFLAAGNYLGTLSGGFVDFLVTFLMNQVSNSIQALLWFSYWPGPGESMLIWIMAGYLGYWLGVESARRQLTMADLLSFRKST